MNICVVGLNHTTAGVELRGRISFRKSEMKRQLNQLCSYANIDGAVIVSTCNRTEIYVSTPNPEDALAEVKTFLLVEKNVTPEELERSLYAKVGREAIEHLFIVVASLDSMVLGEQQIIGQMRTAFKEASHAGCVNMVLTRLFRQAMECGKRVRSQTMISESHVSVSTVAIDIAKRAFDDFADKTVLVVGAGEASELAARYLKEQGVEAFIVSSRTREHAIVLAEELGGVARRFEDLKQLVNEADIIVSGTAATRYVITPDMFDGTQRDKVLILDIAIPRDVDPACSEVEGVIVRDLDDIGREIGQNKDSRSLAAEQARAIVAEETEAFLDWSAGYAVTPLIKAIRLDAERIRQQEVKHLLRTLDVELSEKDLESLECATSAIVKKILHEPTVRIRESASAHSEYETIDAARYLFDVPQVNIKTDAKQGAMNQ